MKKIAVATVVLAALGVLNAGYALWQHYAPAGSAFCNISARFSCDIVNKSTFSEVAGVPVALIGILGNLAFLVIGIMLLRPTVSKRVTQLFLLLALGALAFSLYLTGVEVFLLGTYCPICLLSQALVIAVTALAVVAWRKSRLR